MKKQLKSLIIGIAVVAVLVVVLLLLLRAPEEEESSSIPISSSSSASKSVELLSLTLEDIQSIEVKNTQEYTLVRDTAAGENEWMIEELAGLPKVKNSYGMLAIAMCSLTARDTLGENVTDLAQYGLDPAASTVTVVMKDGTRHTIEVGNDAPGGSTYTYVKLPNSNTVYLCSTSDIRRTRQVLTDYISLDLFTLESTESMPEILNCVFGGTSRKEPMIIEAPPANTSSSSSSGYSGYSSSFLIRSHRDRDVSTQVFSDVMETVFNTVATEVAAYNVTEEQLAQYGLDEPYSTLDLKYKENDITYELHYRAGEPDSSGSFYLMLEGVPVVYRAYINMDYSNTWMNIQYATMASRLFILPYINDVKALTVTTPEGDYRFELTLVDEGTDDEKLNVHYNGKALTEKNFKKFYQVVIGPTTESLVESEEGLNLTQPLLTYTYEYKDESKAPDVVSFYKWQTRQVYVAINGECEFTTRDVYVDKVYGDVIKMTNDEEVITDW